MDKKLERLKETWKSLNENEMVGNVSIDSGSKLNDDPLRTHHIFLDTRKIGFVEVWVDEDNVYSGGAEISDVSIEETWRGKGIYGRVLLLLADKYSFVMSRADDTVSPQAKRVWQKVGGEEKDGYLFLKGG